MSILHNPGAAFGVADAPEDVVTTKLCAVSTIAKGELVALSSSAGYVIRALVATADELVIGVALERGNVVGKPIRIQTKGYHPAVSKGTAALTAGNILKIDATVSGAVGSISAATAVSNTGDLATVGGMWMIVAASVTDAATTVPVWFR